MAKAQLRFKKKQLGTNRRIFSTAVLVVLGVILFLFATNHDENDDFDLGLLSESIKNNLVVNTTVSDQQGILNAAPSLLQDENSTLPPHSGNDASTSDSPNNPLLDSLPRDPSLNPLVSQTFDGGTCFRETYHANQWAYARIIVFQRDGGLKLIVLDPNSIVVINHKGVDPYTKKVLTAYGKQGVHVWNCTGPWQSKALMWSAVTRAYGNSSRFVFPLDLDEYLITFQNNSTYHELEWSQKALYDALHQLEINIDAAKGRPFKLYMYDPVPRDCVASYQHSKDVDMDNSCRLKFVQSRAHKCLLKTFCRGPDFVGTDTGNHFGGTVRHPNHTAIKETCFSERGLFFKKVFSKAQNLALLHLSEVTFEDWLTHILRGAGDYDFNHESAECKGNGNHYCTSWQVISQLQFNMWKMRAYYRKSKCFSSIELKNSSTVEWTLPGCV